MPDVIHVICNLLSHFDITQFKSIVFLPVVSRSFVVFQRVCEATHLLCSNAENLSFDHVKTWNTEWQNFTLDKFYLFILFENSQLPTHALYILSHGELYKEHPVSEQRLCVGTRPTTLRSSKWLYNRWNHLRHPCS